jgi:LAS superfamily LD-carboxypeptidase LdcB
VIVEPSTPAKVRSRRCGRSGQSRTRGSSGPRAWLVRATWLALALIIAGAGPGLAQTNDPTTDTTDTTDTADPTNGATTTTQTSTTQTSGGSETPETTDATNDTSTGQSTSSQLSDDQLQAERDRVKRAEAVNDRKIDLANANLSAVTGALADINGRIKSQEAAVDLASQRVESAQLIAAAATEDVAELQAQVDDLENKAREQAIRSFTGDVVHGPGILLADDPNDALRVNTLLNTATRSNIDYVTELVKTEDALNRRRAQADEAMAVAEDLRRAGQLELDQLESEKAVQADVAAEADQKLDHLLSERAALASLGVQLETRSKTEEDALVKELGSVPAPPPPATPAPVPVSTGALDIRDAGKGIEVDVSILADIQRLLADAETAGVDLAGGGYRDPSAQVRTRRNNCGTSNYAIYEMPARQCRPPTARPGRSMHEQGKAIDFTYNGRLIRSRSGAGWNWLKANAANYGLKNLPSEPWHWSTNGR